MAREVRASRSGDDNPVATDFVNDAHRRHLVRQQQINGDEIADLDDAGPVELGVIGNDDDAGGLRQDSPLELRLAKVAIEKPLIGADGGNRENGAFRRKLLGEIDRRGPICRAIVSADLPACHEHLVAVADAKIAGDFGGIGDDGEVAVQAQGFCDVARRAAVIDHQGFPVDDKGGCQLRNFLLLSALRLQPAQERRLKRGIRQHDPAMDFLHRAIFRHFLDVAANRFIRHIQFVRQIGDAAGFFHLKHVHDCQLSFGLFHGPPSGTRIQGAFLSLNSIFVEKT